MGLNKIALKLWCAMASSPIYWSIILVFSAMILASFKVICHCISQNKLLLMIVDSITYLENPASKIKILHLIYRSVQLCAL